MRKDDSNPLIRYLQRPGGPQAVAAAQVQLGLGVSQPTLSRLAHSAGDAVVRIGQARASRSALARTLGRLGLANSGYAFASLTTNPLEAATDTTNCLELSNFGFSICESSIIDSITVEIDRGRSALGDNVTDVKIVLVNPIDLSESQNKANTSASWTVADAVATYGGDNWGIAWTPEMISDPGFAVRIQARIDKPLGVGQARIDNVIVHVYCTLDGCPKDTTVNLNPLECNAVINYEFDTCAFINCDAIQIADYLQALLSQLVLPLMFSE